MNILHVVSTYPPYRGGMGGVACHEVTQLAALGHTVHVATLARGDKRGVSIEDGVTVHRCRSQVPYGVTGLSVGVIRLMFQRWDAVHIHAPFFGVQELVAILMWLGWRPKRLVVTYHMDIVAHGFVKAIAAISRKFFLGTLVRRAQRIIVAADDYARSSWLKDHWGAIEPKLALIPFGVDIRRYRPVARPVHDGTLLLFLGVLDRHHYFKGLGVLIRAMGRLRDRMDWHLAVAGDGDLRSTYETMAREHGLDGRITFVGRVSDEEKARLYAESDAFVFPSADRSEAFGLVALEAQSSGTPVIASNLDAVRTVVKDGETGLLVSPKDDMALAEAIAWMIEHPSEREAMGERARQRVEALFSWERHMKALEALYRTL